MKKIIFLVAIALTACKSDVSKSDQQEAADLSMLDKEEMTSAGKSGPEIIPLSHATMVLKWDNTVIYVDPVGGAATFSDMAAPNLILVTDIHGDHLDLETLKAVAGANTVIVGPEAVTDEIGQSTKASVHVMYNGDRSDEMGIQIEAIPMYNLRKEALQFHHPGRGNGYVLEKDGQRVYISGDTEDIPEMRALKNIDIAFVCMNLPYTMTVESAASAVLEFKPKKVYPYHYRGTEGLSDVSKFKEIVTKGNDGIEVIQLDWYPKK